MLTFSEFTESFDSPEPLTWNEWTSHVEAKFTVTNAQLGKLEYVVDFTALEPDYTWSDETDPRLKGRYEVTFGLRNSDTINNRLKSSGYPDGYNRDLYNLYGITGTGNAPKIFSTVIVALKTFMTKYHPNSLFFTAEEPSRRKLYRRLLSMVPRTTEYKFKEHASGDYEIYKGQSLNPKTGKLS